ncbi:CHY zinc finger domain-containing protein [Spironucleus salmonicida]|uniref:CHY zinc finger domain-containing protein n=1 Tax=Spironucleus salmonicida TaxID=348837 RepID=V6M4C0_9EUKA|nr:CHY zinc finger domain-containing protein [Spironucleus salmonicida]|eukprot:EST48159.1 hypothetical protein SS50377_11677 [Spironucleus salmonicida]
MCKHVPNVQTQAYARCCKRWYDCAQCHAETQDHPIEKSPELVLICKKCKKTFRIDFRDGFDQEADGFCPRCDNQWFIEAADGREGQEVAFAIQAMDGVDQNDLIRDERDHNKEERRQRMMEERIFKGDAGVDIYDLLDEVSD